MAGSASAATKTIDVGTVYTNSTSALAAETLITVPAGAAFDFRSTSNAYKNYQYVIYISGTGPDGLGALRNTGTVDFKTDDANLTKIALNADALIKANRYMSLLAKKYARTQLSLNGHTLTIDMATGKSFAFYHVASASATGTVRLRNGILAVPSYSSDAGSDLENATFEIVGANSELKVSGLGIYVKNLLMSDSARLTGKGFVGINGGVFKPSETASAFTGTLRIWGSSITIDLSGLDGTWMFPAYDFYKVTSSTVTIKPGAWVSTRSGLIKLVSWSELPSNITFVLDSESRKHYRLVADSAGLWLRRKPGLVITVF